MLKHWNLLSTVMNRISQRITIQWQNQQSSNKQIKNHQWINWIIKLNIYVTCQSSQQTERLNWIWASIRTSSRGGQSCTSWPTHWVKEVSKPSQCPAQSKDHDWGHYCQDWIEQESFPSKGKERIERYYIVILILSLYGGFLPWNREEKCDENFI